MRHRQLSRAGKSNYVPQYLPLIHACDTTILIWYPAYHCTIWKNACIFIFEWNNWKKINQPVTKISTGCQPPSLFRKWFGFSTVAADGCNVLYGGHPVERGSVWDLRQKERKPPQLNARMMLLEMNIKLFGLHNGNSLRLNQSTFKQVTWSLYTWSVCGRHGLNIYHVNLTGRQVWLL